MARADVRTVKAHRLTQHGYTFQKDKPTIITDTDLIEKLKTSAQFRVRDLTVEALLEKPDPKDDFLRPEPVMPAEEYKYHKLIAMRKEDLQAIAYEMGVEFDAEVDLKRDIVQGILDKQISLMETNKDEVSD